MGTLGNVLPMTLNATSRSDDERMKGLTKALDSIKRLSGEAISLARQYEAEVRWSDELLDSKMHIQYDLAIGRAKRIHQERCRIIQRIASFARLATLEAAGSLIIDETTASTGLDERDRSMIAEVSGACSRW